MEPAAHILIVDDQPDSLLILEDLLGQFYTVRTASCGRAALSFLERGGRADMVLLDIIMPDIDGFSVCQQIKSDPRFRGTPVLFLTSLDNAADEARGLALGAEDFIRKPYSPPVVLARVGTHLKLARAARQLHNRNVCLEHAVVRRMEHNVRQSRELLCHKREAIASQGATITAFCSLAEARDNETGNHIRRTQHYIRILAEHVRGHPRFARELNDETIELLFKSAPLHDVGKVAIPDTILLKPGKLTPEEWAIMKRHTIFGRDAIALAESELGTRKSSFLRYAREIAYGHHERWDGSGYPQGLKGEAIPLSARLMAVADVYDALISKRVYKDAYSHETAIAMMAKDRGTHFDPDILDALLAVADHFRKIADEHSDPASVPGDRADSSLNTLAA